MSLKKELELEIGSKVSKEVTGWFIKGFLQFYLLFLIEKGYNYGYDIIKELEERFGFKANSGLIYPILSKLEEKGLVQSSWTTTKPQRKLFKLTAKGRIGLKLARIEIEKILDSFPIEAKNGKTDS